MVLGYDTFQNKEVFPLLQDSFCRLIGHANAHGGWTIVGWYKRAERADEEKQDGEELISYESLRMNVSYLAPTNIAQIPDNVVLNVQEAKKLVA